MLESVSLHASCLQPFITFMACLFFWCLFVLQVSTADQRRSSPKTMVSCNKKSLYLPPEMPAIHVEFTEYYFPDGKDYPSKTNDKLSLKALHKQLASSLF